MKHKFRKPAVFALVGGCLLLICGMGIWKFSTGSDAVDRKDLPIAQSSEATETMAAVILPWETNGAKIPEDYTMEDYEKLSPEQQKAFQEHLGTAGYEEWLKNSVAASDSLPWKKDGAMQPKDYSWAEYQALTEIEQQAFMADLGPYGLETWLQKVLPQKENTTNTSSNSTTASSGSNSATGKEPKDYTLAEYQALSAAEKKAFVDRLGVSGFQAWLTKVQGQKVSQGQKETYPWENAGEKQPENYTLEEYKALTAAQQKAFQAHLGSSGFAAWQKKFQEPKYPWEVSGAKQPKDYTWEEYKALTAAQQKAFQEHLGARGFENWRELFFKVEEYPWEKDGAKQPTDYTWEEYKALTEDQQYAFQRDLGAAGMETWLKKVTDIPWDQADAKQPEKYTLEEYQKLTEQQQLAFQVRLGAIGFDAWNEEAHRVKEVNPWEKTGAKQPKDYTLAEYEALTVSQQLAFQNHLGSENFENWMNKAESQQNPNPWEKTGAKQPADYTLAEYEALTASQQMAFQNHLGSEAFNTWLNKYQNQAVANPWDASGAKQPADYTMAEYEALTASQQMAFQDHLGSEGFEAWLNKYQNQAEANPWDTPGAKQPADYTMEEFNALTGSQQMAFQNHLGPDGFAAWLNRGQPQAEANPWDAAGTKPPVDYTMAEYEALTASQQIAFQNHLGPDGFEAWLNAALGQPQAEANPWDVPGAKQPADYTWEEFDELTGAQQIAFQNHLGPDGFEAWLIRVGMLRPEENPVNQEDSPVITEENPVNQEETPVITEETPVITEENPVNSEGIS